MPAALAACAVQAGPPVLHHTSSRAAAARRAARRSAAGAAHAARARSIVAAAPSDFEALQQHPVLPVSGGAAVALPAAWGAQPGRRACVACLTHFADLSSTELAQKLLAVLPELRAAGVGLLAVGLGEPEKGRRFAELLGFPPDLLYADPTGELYRALGFSPGFAPEAPVSAYAKLLPMLAGVGSPGTLQEVVRGYLGDAAAKPVFAPAPAAAGGAGLLGGNPFDVLGGGYQRPLELATLRLLNMGTVLSHWGELAPTDERLLTQQGGCLGFDGTATIYRHADSGILKYAPVDELVAALLPPGAPTEAPTQTLRTLF